MKKSTWKIVFWSVGILVFLTTVIIAGSFFLIYKRIARHGSSVSQIIKTYKNARKNLEWEKQVYNTGKTAKATILDMHYTDFAVRNYSEIEMLLLVQTNSGDSFQVKTKKMISWAHIAAYKKGAVLNIKYDPTDSSKVAIISVQAGTGSDK